MPAELWVRCEKCGCLCKTRQLLGLHDALAHMHPEKRAAFESTLIITEEEKARSKKRRRKRKYE